MQDTTTSAPVGATPLYCLSRDLKGVQNLICEAQALSQIICMAAGSLNDESEGEAFLTVSEDLTSRLSKAFSMLRVLADRCSISGHDGAAQEGGAS